MTRWFRSYADKHRNPKVARLSDSDFRLWDQLLCVASENDGHIPPLDDLKHLLNRRLDHLSSGLKRLVDGRLIEPLNDGYVPRNWNEKQYKSDSSTPRVQKFREKGNVTRNVSETPPDTDTDTDTEKGEANASPRGRAQGKRLEDGWEPETLKSDTVSGQIVAARGHAWAARALESFRNHWRSANGPNARKRDWQAAWANWIIEQDNRDGRRNGNGNTASNVGKSAAAFAMLNPSNDLPF